MIVHNASLTEASRKAHEASLGAQENSYIGHGPGRHIPPNRFARMATTLSTRARLWAANVNSPSDIYKTLLLHEATARLHRYAARDHRRIKEHLSAAYHGEHPLNDQHNIANRSHLIAAKAHEDAARVAAGQLRMDFNTHRGLKDYIRENPTDPAGRGVLQDFLQEHGLDKEARRLRIDPTGHISRVIRAYNLVKNEIPDFSPIHYWHRTAVNAGIRAKLGRSQEGMMTPESIHRNAANLIDALIGGYLSNRHLRNRLNQLSNAHRQAVEHYKSLRNQ